MSARRPRRPSSRRSGFDVGAGKGKSLKAKLTGGMVGIIFDCRGRQPFVLPKEPQERIRKLVEWCEALDVYPEGFDRPRVGCGS